MLWFLLFLLFSFDKSLSITNTGAQENTVLDTSTIVISLESYNVSNPDGESVESFHLLSPNQTSKIVLTQIPTNVYFVILQVHSYLVNITLALDEVSDSKNSITGTNVGLLKFYKKTDLMFYMSYNSSSEEGEIMIAAQAYSKKAPVPGGCNMEFQVEISPFLLTTYDEVTTQVAFGPSAPPLPLPPFTNSECNIKPSPVKHKMYHQYFPERDFTKDTYFAVLSSMMTKGRVQKNGVLVPEKLTAPPMKRTFATYPGTGNAFVVISEFDNHSSVYVPSFSYGCSDLKDNNTCEVLTTTFSKVLCAAILFMGLFTCYFGHYFFRIEIFLFGFFTSGILFYILVSILYTDAIALSTSVSGGFITATLMLFAWTIFGLPIMSVILTTSAFGFLVASMIYYPLIDYVNLMVLDNNFWGIFIGIVVSCPFLMLCLAEKANIICCAFLGSYIAIVSIDHYIGSNLRFIVLNIIRRATDDGFKLAVISPPFQIKDALLCVLWSFFMLTGIKVQRLLMKNRPPYPPPVNPLKKLFTNVGKRPSHRPNERTPLLIDEPQNAAPASGPSPYDMVRDLMSSIKAERDFNSENRRREYSNAQY